LTDTNELNQCANELVKKGRINLKLVTSVQMQQTLAAIKNCKTTIDLAWQRPLIYYRMGKIAENYHGRKKEESFALYHYLSAINDLIKKTDTPAKLKNLQFIIETITTKHQTNGK
jgi:hypothetical protein